MESPGKRSSLEDGAPAGLYELDGNGVVRACNARFAELLGLGAPAGVVGTSPLAPLSSAMGELATTTADGGARTLFRFERAGEKGSRKGALVDATELVAARDRAATGNAMDATGRALGAVGHELNNLLAIILNYGTMIAGELTPQHPLMEDVQEVLTTAQRAVALTRRLLAVGRREVSRAGAIDLGEVAADVLAGVGDGGVVTVALTLAKGVHASIDAGQLEAILRALVDNALEAMPAGGHLEVKVERVRLAPHEIPGVDPGLWAEARVSDDGRGMSPEVLARAVEPFFSTKTNSKGIGVGLSSAFARVRQAGGHLVLSSTPGAGTEVRLLLPVPSGDAELGSSPPGPMPTAVAPAPWPVSPRRTRSYDALKIPTRARREVVLVVDDEDGVRALVSRLLGRQGYLVIEARGPGEALLMAERYPTGIDLLLTDVIMPNMTGNELAERLVAQRPALKVLLMSGFTGDALVGKVTDDMPFLQKPFTEEVLAAQVRAVLDASAPSGA